MKLSTGGIGIIIAILLVCCCLTAGASVLVISATFAEPDEIAFALATPSATTTNTPTQIPTRPRSTETLTPAPTNTRVIPIPAPVTPTTGRGQTPLPARPSPTPPLSSNPYMIVVPTPTASAKLNYPVAFDSTFKVVTYTVIGKTTTDLSKSLDTHAIADPHEPGSRYYAQTEWYVSSDWSWKPAGNRCELERATISIAITMTLPALATTQGIAPDALNRWNTFIGNTITHEKGHVTRALDGGRDYQRGLGTLPSQSNCDVMRPKLDSLFKYYLDAIDRVNVTYDAETNHGFSQGAVFP